MIDLDVDANIKAITFNTARYAKAGVNYPSHIAAFIGSTKDQFHYVGNIANAPDSLIWPYQVKKFTLNDIKARGRYILLLIQPNGPFLFCDEIEVLEDEDVTSHSEGLSLEAARNFSLELNQVKREQKLLGGLLTEITKDFEPSNDNALLLTEVQQRLDTLSTIKDAESIEVDLFKLRATLLRTRSPGNDLTIRVINPWNALSPFALSTVEKKNLSIELPQGGYDNAAVVVTNLSKDDQKIIIKTDNLPTEAPELTFYEVPFIKSATIEYVADPLVPIKYGVNLRSGESKMIFITAHGLHSGKWENTLNIGTTSYSTTLPLSLEVSNVAIPSQLSLNTINWGNLNFKPIKDHKTEAVKDLLNHHINVIDIPPRYIPMTETPSVKELAELDDYLTLHAGVKKALFFLNFSNEKILTNDGKYSFMSDEWKEWFKKLYTILMNSAVKAGFQKDQVYIYSYDEIKENDLNNFIEFSTWAHKEIEEIKLYGTLDSKESLLALPYLDIAQVLNHDNLYADAIKSKKEIWLYGTSVNTKSLSPYTYYRLMSWKAFALGFTGAGFWNYADTGSGEYAGSAWDDFDGRRPDFSVIYEGNNGDIISSRRWEAWRMGVEDYELLRMYSKAKGDKAANNLAELVINNPDNLGMADEVRHKIMHELSI